MQRYRIEYAIFGLVQQSDRQTTSGDLGKKNLSFNQRLFMKRFEGATSRPYSYLVVDLKPNTTEQDRLKTDIFESSDLNDFEMSDDVSDVDDTNSIESLEDDIGPPGKRRKVKDNSRSDIWSRRFQDPLRQANKERFKANVNDYAEKGFPSDKAIRVAANDDLPHLRKKISDKSTRSS